MAQYGPYPKIQGALSDGGSREMETNRLCDHGRQAAAGVAAHGAGGADPGIAMNTKEPLTLESLHKDLQWLAERVGMDNAAHREAIEKLQNDVSLLLRVAVAQVPKRKPKSKRKTRK